MPRCTGRAKSCCCWRPGWRNCGPCQELQAALKPLLGGRCRSPTDDDPEEFPAEFRSPALALLAAASHHAAGPRSPKRRRCSCWGAWTARASGPPPADTGWALLALGSYFKGVSFGTEPVEIAISQPGVPASPSAQTGPQGLPHRGPGRRRPCSRTRWSRSKARPAKPGSTSWS